MDLIETVCLTYEVEQDGVTTSVNVTTDETEGLYLGDVAKMFMTFLHKAGFYYVEDVIIETAAGHAVSASD